MPNFTFLAGLERAEKYVVVGVGLFQVATISNLNPSYFELL